ncbi:hypothetical protein [Hymenobacter sp. PAMC 26628]|uniref:hypothetical protein n=1 Tax=Hymenobacter sp. PAMC 26628 TaxID=1484118 RepID=UPI0007705D29|nr:hypothetical protein [Hymenobacter sp. PAMC 26628]AMJ64087.1 hypothetical protein AXW84_00565 [Hymenobacter sp. PAMC 26628]
MLLHLLLQLPAPGLAGGPLRPYCLALENDLVGATLFFSMFALLGGALFFSWSGATCPGAGTPP